MIGPAARVATLPLRRRLVGRLLVLAGVAVVALGMVVDLGRVSGSVAGSLPPPGLSLPRGVAGDSAAVVLRHALDHPLAAADRTSTVADLALRAGVTGVAGGAVLALLLLLVPLRGFVGWAGGLGLLGLGAVAGVVVGSGHSLADLGPGSLRIAVGPAVPLLAAGLAAIVVGGALAALRPLAGVMGAVTLSLAGAAVGAGLALAVGGDPGLVALPPR